MLHAVTARLALSLALAILLPSAPACTRLSSPAASAPAGAFVGNFDSGSASPWVVQAANYGYSDKADVHFGDFALDAAVVGEGRFSGRFSVPAFPGGRTRSQLFTRRPINAGGDDYYSLMFYVPQGGFQPGTSGYWGVQIAELNYEGIAGGQPSFSLVAEADHVTARLCTGNTEKTSAHLCPFNSNADAPGTTLPGRYAVPKGKLVPGWHEFVIHAHWSISRSGVIEVWHRLKGQVEWVRTVRFKGYPTLQTHNGAYPPNTIDVIQAYRGPSTSPVTVWLDGFGRWPTLRAARAALP